MPEIEKRHHQRFDIERTIRAVANGELRLAACRTGLSAPNSTIA